MRKKRIFVGISLPSEIKTKIKKFQHQLNISEPNFRWTRVENLHITLNFLGHLKDREVVEVEHVMDQVIPRFSAFKTWISEIRFFPSERYARIVALMIKDKDDLEKLQKELSQEFSRLPFVKLDRREYKPHLTIARIKGRIKDSNLQKIKNARLKIEWEIDNAELIHSVLGRTGPKYTVLKKYQLT